MIIAGLDWPSDWSQPFPLPASVGKSLVRGRAVSTALLVCSDWQVTDNEKLKRKLRFKYEDPRVRIRMFYFD